MERLPVLDTMTVLVGVGGMEVIRMGVATVVMITLYPLVGMVT